MGVARPRTARAASVALASLAAWLHPAPPLTAQASSGLWLDVGASEVRPPVGVEGDPGRYVVGGLRAALAPGGGARADVSVLAGRSLDGATGGDFLSGSAVARLAAKLAPGWTGELEGRVLAFTVTEPFPYRAAGVEGGPAVSAVAGPLLVRLGGVAGVARSRVEVRSDRLRGGVRVLEEELWRYGAEGEALLGRGPLYVGVGGEAHRTPGGAYRAGGGRLLWAREGGLMELRLDVWRTPAGTRTTGGLLFSWPLGGRWTARGFAGRSAPDPLMLSEPGAGSAGALLSWALAEGAGRDAGGATVLYAVEARTGTGARVTVRLAPPGAPQEVALLGDFTLWEPIPMRREGDVWTVSLEVPYGTHHFGFLVDGAWYVPDDAPDRVDDAWGRMNATMVIER